jgi:outer membrane receptor for ferrienterochelin and colicin
MKDVRSLPGFLGEKDVMKSLTVLPGVSQGYEGSSGIYVRGGSPDQNLILLDGVPVYNVSHLFGFVSVFTPEALQHVDLYKGGFPARYGGRLSSVVDVHMKEGNMYKPHSSLVLGPVSSEFMHEGPVVNGKSSFLISGRRTLLDLLVTEGARLAQMNNDEKIIPGLNFYDTNAKFNFYINPENRLYISLYKGGDRLFSEYSDRSEWTTGVFDENRTKVDLKWGNTLAALRWNSQVSPRIFVNTTLAAGAFQYGIHNRYSSLHTENKETDLNKATVDYQTRIATHSVQVLADWYLANGNRLSLGAEAGIHIFQPGKRHVLNSSGITLDDGNQEVRTIPLAVFVEDNFAFSNRVHLNAGLRYEGEFVNEHLFNQASPRVNMNYRLTENWQFSASLAIMFQPLHLLTNSSIGLPSDIWVPATRNIRPETSQTASIGITHNFSGQLRWSGELYGKMMHDVVQYKAGHSFMDLAKDWEQMVYQGKGRAWGFENAFDYQDRQVKAWLYYTLAQNQRQVDELNNGNYFPYKFDRRHDLNVGFNYKLTEKVSFTAMWVFQSGQAATIASGDYPVMGEIAEDSAYDPVFGFELRGWQPIDLTTHYNAARLPSYHHLDVEATFTRQQKKSTREWRVGIFNVYARQNAYYYYPYVRKNGTRGYKQISILPFLPSISYRLTF